MKFPKKIWTLEEAKKILPLIYKITEDFFLRVDKLNQKIQGILPENELEILEEQISKEIQLWMLNMLDLGVEVKGLWLVDFDNGKGYYCWKYDEKDIFYEHDYHSGFAGRKLIKKDSEEGL
ncbi:MAG: DUF2203 domain-containing protein [Leptonema sp. (in: bacteria)]